MVSRTLKIAACSTLAVAGALGGVAAQADTALPIDGNSNLVLFVRNTSTNTAYARALTLTVDSVMTAGQIIGDTYTGPGDLVNPNVPIGPYTKDPNLDTFLQSCGGNCTWGIMAGDSTPLGNNLADQRYVQASPFDLTQSWFTPNSDLTSTYSQVNNLFVALNGNLSGAAGTDSSTLSGLWGVPSTSGENAPSWYGAGYYENNLNDTAQMYLVTSSGGAGGGAGNAARLYLFGTMSLGDDGTLTFTANEGGTPVPLPAAAWLLLSGFAGLVGVGRRRNS